MQIKDAKDFWSGVMFAAFGAVASSCLRAQYDMGTAARMGPAYLSDHARRTAAAARRRHMPSRGSWPQTPTTASGTRFHFKPLFLVLGAVVAFGLLLRPAGLLVSLAALVIISSLGSDEFRLRDVLLLTVGLALLVSSSSSRARHDGPRTARPSCGD